MTLLWVFVWLIGGLVGFRAVRNDFPYLDLPRSFTVLGAVAGLILFFSAIIMSFVRTGTPHRLFFEEQEHLEW